MPQEVSKKDKPIGNLSHTDKKNVRGVVRSETAREMMMSEQQRKPYSKPGLTCYRDLRTITLGNSINPTESFGSGEPIGPDFTDGSQFEAQRSRSSSAGDSGGRGGRSGS